MLSYRTKVPTASIAYLENFDTIQDFSTSSWDTSGNS